MYKIIIADDEKSIRQGLAKFIPWNDLGFQVVLDCEDGCDALDYIKRNHVDVLLTDIKMKRVSGIDVARYVHENSLTHPKVLFLSGYKEFDFARKAMHYNVYDYILKPTKNSEIIKLFRKLKKELDMESNHGDDAIGEKEQIIVDILSGGITDHKRIMAGLNALKIPVDENTSFAVITLNIKNYDSFFSSEWNYGRDRLFGALRSFLKESPEYLELVPLYRIGRVIPIFAIIRKFLRKEDIGRIMDDITKKIRDQISLSAAASVKVIYENCRSLANDKPFFSILKDGSREDINEYAEEMSRLMILHINENDQAAINKLLSRIRNDLSSKRIENSRMILILICNILIIKYQNANMNFITSAIENEIGSIRKCRGMQEMYVCIDRLFQELKLNTKNNALSTPDLIIAHIRQYIEQNFDKDITLESIAEHVFLSAAYISKLFKRKVGENISDYILKVRMDYAIKLLQYKNIKVYEICERVGYKSTQYFYKIFKKYTGKTPTEYRDSL